MAQTTSGNGQQTPLATPPPGGQQLFVNAQYIKDLSFENPRAPHSLTQQGTAPAVEINVDVKAQNLNPETYEVVLTVNESAKIGDDSLFIVAFVYCGVVTAHYQH